jgi:FkbM family methyltransferase
MKIGKKKVKKVLASFGITPYVYFTYKYNNPLEVKRRIFGNDKILIFDIGAYDGRSASKYLKEFPKGEIYSFEPTKKSFEKLKKSFGTNTNVKIFNTAFSDFKGETEFYVNNSGLTNSLLKLSNTKINNEVYNLKEESIEKVAVTTLDIFTKEMNIDKINILKIDVQGAELSVLKGAQNLLKSKKIDVLFVEVEFLKLYANQPLFHDISSFLYQNDYHLYSLYNLTYSKEGQMVYGDAIFLNSDIINKKFKK